MPNVLLAGGRAVKKEVQCKDCECGTSEWGKDMKRLKRHPMVSMKFHEHGGVLWKGRGCFSEGCRGQGWWLGHLVIYSISCIQAKFKMRTADV